MTIDLSVGQQLPELVHVPTTIQLFRYSAVTWNPHRIHYEDQYAQFEGHPGPLVHSHLRAAMAFRCVLEGLGSDYELVGSNYRLRVPTTPGHQLRYNATVTGIDGPRVTLDVNELLPSGSIGLECTATVQRRSKNESS